MTPKRRPWPVKRPAQANRAFAINYPSGNGCLLLPLQVWQHTCVVDNLVLSVVSDV